MTKKLTIHDIARLAGVSKSTVSRILNQSSRVDPATREHVLRVIEEHGFAPSINATGLKGRSQLIGMLVPALTWPLILNIIAGVARVFECTSYEIILYCCPPNKDYRDIVDRIVATKLTAGLLAMIHWQSPDHLIELHQQGLPVVIVNTTGIRTNLPLVVADNYGGAYQAVRHLIGLGHRRIAYIHGPADLPCSQDRYRGYCDALHEVGLSPDPTLFQQGRFEPTSGRRGAEALFDLAEPPTAIFTCNDDTAYGVLDVAKVRGIRIPQDVAVIGFDDNTPSASTHPALSTIRQPFHEMGQCAAELLLSMLDPQYEFSEDWRRFSTNYQSSPTASLEKDRPLQIQLPTDLVVRESCGAAQHILRRDSIYRVS